ncbi:MAG: DMT family transporter [Cyanophyceae cyanobacterium]
MVYVQLVLTAIVWGGTFIAGRLVVESVDPFAVAFMRFAIATVALLIVTYSLEGGLALKLRQLPQILVLGLSGVFAYNIFFFLGLQTVPAGRAALIVALNPIAIALFSALFLGERLTPLKLLGIATSLWGAAIVIGRGNPLDLLTGGVQIGDLFMFGCVASWVVYTLVGKQVMGQLSPLVATTSACIVGAIALLPPALQHGLMTDIQKLSLAAGLAVLYLGLFGSALGFSWYYSGVRSIGAAKASIFINLVPIAAILLAALLLGEPITLALAVGGALVIAGVFCTNRG